MKRGQCASSVMMVMCVISLVSLESIAQAPRRVERTPQAEVKKMEKIVIPAEGLVLSDGLRFESTASGGVVYLANNSDGVKLTCNCKKQKAGKGSCVATYNPKTKSVKCTVKDGCQQCGGFVEVAQGSAIAAAIHKAVKATNAQITTTDPRATRAPLTPGAELKQTKRMAPGSRFKLPDGYTFKPKGTTGGVVYLDNSSSTVEFDCDCGKRAPGSKKGSCKPVFNSGTGELYCVPVAGSCSECSPIIIWEEENAVQASILIKSVKATATRR